MHRDLYIKTLAKTLYPQLREMGFKGSGTTLRHLQNDVAKVFHIQGSAGGDGCYVNLGLHILTLEQNPRRGKIIPEKIREGQCVIRKRMMPGLNPITREAGNSRWLYGESEDEMMISIQTMIRSWEERGAPVFKRFTCGDDLKSFISKFDLTGYGEGFNASNLNHIGFNSLIALAKHFGMTERLALIEAEGKIYGDIKKALRTAALEKRG